MEGKLRFFDIVRETARRIVEDDVSAEDMLKDPSNFLRNEMKDIILFQSFENPLISRDTLFMLCEEEDEWALDFGGKEYKRVRLGHGQNGVGSIEEFVKVPSEQRFNPTLIRLMKDGKLGEERNMFLSQAPVQDCLWSISRTSPETVSMNM